MNPTITKLALQALLGRRRFWALLAFPVVMISLTVALVTLADGDAGFALIEALGFPLVLPLIALMAASAVLGPEVDDGSVVYLLAKPVNRHAVAISKWVVAWAATLVVGGGSLLVAGLVSGDERTAVAWLAAGVVSGTAYSALFLALSALTRHAVVVGLLFVLIWETLLGGLLSGVAWLSIAQWGVRLGHEVSTALPDPASLPWAIGAALAVTLGGVWFAGDRLRSFSLTGDE